MKRIYDMAIGDVFTYSVRGAPSTPSTFVPCYNMIIGVSDMPSGLRMVWMLGRISVTVDEYTASTTDCVLYEVLGSP